MAAGFRVFGADAADCCLPDVISFSVSSVPARKASNGISAVISACERGEQWQPALLLLASMQQASVLPDVVSISALISACEKGQQWQQASGFLAVIHRSAVLPNVISYIAAISACERGKQWQQALRFWN